MPTIFNTATAVAAFAPNRAVTQARIWSVKLVASARIVSSIFCVPRLVPRRRRVPLTNRGRAANRING